MLLHQEHPLASLIFIVKMTGRINTIQHKIISFDTVTKDAKWHKTNIKGEVEFDSCGQAIIESRNRPDWTAIYKHNGHKV